MEPAPPPPPSAHGVAVAIPGELDDLLLVRASHHDAPEEETKQTTQPLSISTNSNSSSQS